MASRDHSVKASSPFATLLDRRALRRMAGPRSFERGENYFVNRQVGVIAEPNAPPPPGQMELIPFDGDSENVQNEREKESAGDTRRP